MLVTWGGGEFGEGSVVLNCRETMPFMQCWISADRLVKLQTVSVIWKKHQQLDTYIISAVGVSRVE
jgi:hypothetical protein